MHKLKIVTTFAILTLIGWSPTACREPASPEVPQRMSSLSEESARVASGAYGFDAPALRPWDSDPTAVDGVLAAANGRLVVSFKAATAKRSLENRGVRGVLSGSDFNAALTAVGTLGGSVERAWPALGMALVHVTPEAAHALLANSVVDFADPDVPHLLTASSAGLDVRPQRAEGLARRAPLSNLSAMFDFYGDPELDDNWSVGMVHAPEAWSANNGSSDKVMIMSGRGVDLGHADLPTIPPSNCGGAFGTCNGSDGYGYLGNVSLGAWLARRNSYASVGAAPGVTGSNVYSWRLVPVGGSGWYTSTFVDGINMAVSQGVKTLNFIQFYVDTNQASMAAAVAYAWDHNVVMVGAIYGTGSAVYYPAAYSQVIGVSGVLRDRTFADPANPANECGTQSGWGAAMTKVAAPWTATVATSTIPDGDGTWCGGGIAAGYAAGVVSLLRSQNPTWTPAQVRDRLLLTASPAGDAAHFGSGIVNANAALTLGGAIGGPTKVKPFATCEWTATGFGGNPPFTFIWSAGAAAGSGVFFDYKNSSLNGGSFTVQLKTTDVTGSSSWVSKNVLVSNSARDCHS